MNVYVCEVTVSPQRVMDVRGGQGVRRACMRTARACTHARCSRARSGSKSRKCLGTSVSHCVTQVLSSPSAALGERLADEDEEDGSDGGGGDPRTGECKEDGSDGGSAARSLMKEKPECSVVAERVGEEGQ